MQTVLDSIRVHAAGEDCSIQFGSGGENELDIASDTQKYGKFDNTSANPAWGAVTLSGKVTSTPSTPDGGRIIGVIRKRV